MGSTFYLFYMVLFTGGVLWCLFLWLVRDDDEESGDEPEVPPSKMTSGPSSGPASEP